MPAEKDKAVGELLKKVLTWNVHALGPQVISKKIYIFILLKRIHFNYPL